ncbi:hypothetical protein IX84_25660 [Phaeodactylibacter xiamenensis]|uniref:Uncharacterized protein n=1 Tax=Phaeodactylibacter xiamenensis TaxID=1524460 RepID=A0A098S1I7_9BACT|nr:hypothetical protein IX84_25660 [Phaeodactylibacter xiamenensis]
MLFFGSNKVGERILVLERSAYNFVRKPNGKQEALAPAASQLSRGFRKSTDPGVRLQQIF